jgi:hypothetical protein
MWRISCRAFCSSLTTHIRFAMLRTCFKFLSKVRVLRDMILSAYTRPILLAGLPVFFSQSPHLPHFQNPDFTTIWGVLLFLLRCATFMEMWEGLAFIKNRTDSKNVGERAAAKSTIPEYLVWSQDPNVIEAWGVHLTSKISSSYPWEMKHQNRSTYC